MIEFRKDLFADERDDDLNVIGKPERRQDILGHVTGRSPFFDDHLFDGLLHLRCARSPHHAARIRRIDTSAAERMPGVVRVLTGRDVPVNLNTLLSLLDFGLDDEPILSDEKVRYRGEPVAAVIAETEAQARAGAEAVRVDWEVLPHVLDPEEAIAPGAPVVLDIYPGNRFVYHGKYDHQKLRYGDVDAALARADHVVEGRYQMSPIEQAPIETCGAIAAPEQNDRYVCYTSTQALFFSLGTAAKVLSMPSSRLHFVGGTVGGGFGGKVDSVHEPLAILGAMLTGRPVKYAWDREEEMQVGAPRGAERWYVTDGVMADGRIVARKFTGYFDAGAYTRLSSYAIIKAVGHLPGPYTIPNVSADVYCIYTNRTPATAMRGFGITGVDFAIEAHMDKVAETVGMNPVELRILNAYRDGDMKAHRRVAKNCAFIECCQVVAEKAGIAISAEARAASSREGGGGERGQLPAHTATDENGRVEGYRATSYATKGGPTQPPPGAPPAPPRPATAPAQRPAAAQPAPAAAAPPAPAEPHGGQRAQEPQRAAPQGTARKGALRFSSLSGFRRR
ncbi:xanthine dehydrogenase family protein molybdopterin-binding subunit [Rhodosalinus halophilus]|uniref:Xanthine dehydrogenase family protein molybdopterin-binding subunit n=2 Tax=Rhodosalinus halophilus TaxID=2259333 RepID=A0A365UAA3_9RHOB|nr:xanthine dehydrogenase family protein molybdopterin-binding subunit [Rhodosalinus halophilus]